MKPSKYSTDIKDMFGYLLTVTEETELAAETFLTFKAGQLLASGTYVQKELVKEWIKGGCKIVKR